MHPLTDQVLIKARSTLTESVAGNRIAWAVGILEVYPKLSGLRDELGRNLLMVAAYKGSVEVLLFLLAKHCLGGSNSVGLLDVDNEGLTALDWAILGGNPVAESILSELAK